VRCRLRWGALLLALAAQGCSRPGPRVEIQTRYGTILMELDSARAPRTVENFLRYVDQGRYETARFYRVRRDEEQLLQTPRGIVQGGLWARDTALLLPPVPMETTRETGIEHEDGVVSMARFNESSSVRAEFFIVLGRQPHLDFRDTTATGRGYAAFGRVLEGMEVVKEIQRQPVEEEILRRPLRFRIRRLPPS